MDVEWGGTIEYTGSGSRLFESSMWKNKLDRVGNYKMYEFWKCCMFDIHLECGMCIVLFCGLASGVFICCFCLVLPQQLVDYESSRMVVTVLNYVSGTSELS